ncbi:MAG: hypothetical protein GY846_09985 [Deltaproteobacteria bacterium]|nr:hypothetical protein [Deltaproteobacteria bacterium]
MGPKITFTLVLMTFLFIPVHSLSRESERPEEKPTTISEDCPPPKKLSCKKSKRLRENPIELLQCRAPSGKSFKFTVTLPKEMDEGSYSVFFIAKNNRIGATTSIIEKEKEGDWFVYTVRGRVPPYEKIFKKVERTFFEGWWSARRAELKINVSVGGNIYETCSEFAVPLTSTATIWGIIILLFLYMIIYRTKLNLFPADTRFNEGKDDKRQEEWKRIHPSPFIRKAIAPFHLAASPIGNYSISSAQIMFWTGIVVFASVYVFICRSDFLVMTGQVLTLLGISGGTALAAKGNAVVRDRDIPDEYFQGIMRTRVPRFRDLFCISGIPNIFKFQIFAFTLINGIIVIEELFTSFSFPTIPEKQLILMGISNGMYLGNEIVHKNRWETIHKLTQDAEPIRTTDPAKFNEIKNEIRGMLNGIYNLK